MLAFRILFEDSSFVAIDKPSGFHSHPPTDLKIRIHPKWDALKIAEKQLHLKLYPCHRLDRATSGILLFAKSSLAAKDLQLISESIPWKKQYFALSRGEFHGYKKIDFPIKSSKGITKEAITLIRSLFHFERDDLLYRGNKRKFSLLEIQPITGRYHQIRKHLAEISMPIIGDNTHGDKKLNREYFLQFGKKYMFLRAAHLNFFHPYQEKWISIDARWPKQWHFLFEKIGYCPIRGNLNSDLF
jgi:tRNA pseudouridine65 synthase